MMKKAAIALSMTVSGGVGWLARDGVSHGAPSSDGGTPASHPSSFLPLDPELDVVVILGDGGWYIQKQGGVP